MRQQHLILQQQHTQHHQQPLYLLLHQNPTNIDTHRLDDI